MISVCPFVFPRVCLSVVTLMYADYVGWATKIIVSFEKAYATFY